MDDPRTYEMYSKTKKSVQKTLKRNSNTIDHEKYKQYRNSLRMVLRRAKEQYYREKCVEYKRNTSKLWKMVNTIISKQNDKEKAKKLEIVSTACLGKYNPIRGHPIFYLS